MRRWYSCLALTMFGFGLGAPLAAQEPGPLATPTERLDYLLSTWRSQPIARVREVGGNVWREFEP